MPPWPVSENTPPAQTLNPSRIERLFGKVEFRYWFFSSPGVVSSDPSYREAGHINDRLLSAIVYPKESSLAHGRLEDDLSECVNAFPSGSAEVPVFTLSEQESGSGFHEFCSTGLNMDACVDEIPSFPDEVVEADVDHSRLSIAMADRASRIAIDQMEDTVNPPIMPESRSARATAFTALAKQTRTALNRQPPAAHGAIGKPDRGCNTHARLPVSEDIPFPRVSAPVTGCLLDWRLIANCRANSQLIMSLTIN